MNTISSYLSSINWYSQIQSLSGNILGQQVSCSQNQQTGDSVQISSQGLALNKFSQSSFLDKISSILDNLVSDGTISEDQESAVLTALETARTESEQKTEAAGQADDPLAGLVADGTITSEQQAAIKSAFEAMGPPPPPPEMNSANSQSLDPLDSLVSDGTITSEQQDAIKKAFESSIALLQNGSGNTTSIDPLDSLVSNGTITEEQKKMK
jgi:competence protein ComGC